MLRSAAIFSLGCLVLLSSSAHAAASEDLAPTHFVLFSSPALSRIGYVALDPIRGTSSKVHTLVSIGLDTPKTICMDPPRSRLYVCDAGAKKIYFFEVFFSGIFTGGEERRSNYML